MYHSLFIQLTNKVDLFCIGFVAFAFFIFGLFLGKNNPEEVQRIGEQVKKDAAEVKDEVSKEIDQ